MKKELGWFLNGISVVGMSLMVFGAFSLATRNAIRDRSRKRFGHLASEKSGKSDEPLECAHIDHDRSKPGYDHPRNGRVLTLSEHLADHTLRAGRNGLSIEDNNRSIELISERLDAFRNRQ